MLEPRRCWVRVQLLLPSDVSPSVWLQSRSLELQEGSLDSEERFRQLVQRLVSELEQLLPPWLALSHSVTRSVKD